MISSSMRMILRYNGKREQHSCQNTGKPTKHRLD
jgi:hypothetical protein